MSHILGWLEVAPVGLHDVFWLVLIRQSNQWINKMEKKERNVSLDYKKSNETFIIIDTWKQISLYVTLRGFLFFIFFKEQPLRQNERDRF